MEERDSELFDICFPPLMLSLADLLFELPTLGIRQEGISSSEGFLMMPQTPT